MGYPYCSPHNSFEFITHDTLKHALSKGIADDHAQLCTAVAHMHILAFFGPYLSHHKSCRFSSPGLHGECMCTCHKCCSYIYFSSSPTSGKPSVKRSSFIAEISHNVVRAYLITKKKKLPFVQGTGSSQPHTHTHTHTKKCHYDEVSRSCTRTLIVNKYMHDVHYTLT